MLICHSTFLKMFNACKTMIHILFKIPLLVESLKSQSLIEIYILCCNEKYLHTFDHY